MEKTRTRFFFGLISMVLVLLMIITNTFILQLIWVFFFALIQIMLLFELFTKERWEGPSVFQFLVIIASFVYMLIYVMFITSSKFPMFAFGLIGAIFLAAILSPFERERMMLVRPELPIPKKQEDAEVEVVDIDEAPIEEIRPPTHPSENVFTKLEKGKTESKKVKADLARQAKELEKAGKELEKVAKRMSRTTKKTAKKKTAKKKPAKKKKAAKKKTAKKRSTKKSAKK